MPRTNEPRWGKRTWVTIGPAVAVFLAILAPFAMVAGTWLVWSLVGVAVAAQIFAGALGIYWTVTDQAS